MKKYITTVFAKIAFFIMVLFSTFTQAQEPTDLPDEPVDTAPIDDYVWLLVLVAISFAILKFRAICKKSLHSLD